MGLVELFVGVSDIVDLIREFVHLMIWEVNTVLSFHEVLLKDLSDISPLLDHLLSEWGLHEFLIKFFDVVDFLGVSPLLERVLKFVNWLRVRNLLHDLPNVIGLLFNFLLTGLRDADLESTDGIVDGITG